MDKKLKQAVDEARRFLRKAEELAACEYAHSSPRESGAVRRASMDLTRALADYRRRR